MTNKTTLCIEKVIVKAGSKVVYEEKFHEGLNVIRGHNGTGKSTVMELISYGLGGDIKKNSWKREALECSNITIALKLNGSPYILRRGIEEAGSRPQIEIFEGNYLASVEADAVWTFYKNSRSESRKSYSMQIFELLGLQQHKTADSDSLTIHQLLRILYIDQDTPASKIFRTESFTYDKESMRKSIGEYAFGFDDLQAHALRQQLYSVNKEFDKLDAELRIIYKVLGQTNIKATPIEINSEIDALLNDLKKLDGQLKAKKNDINSFEHTGLAKQAVSIQKQLQKQIGLISELESDFISTMYDISESMEFIDTLLYRKQSLEKASILSESVRNVEFKYCPSCMEEIIHTEESHACCLCKNESGEEKSNETYIQALNELDFQFFETNQMLKKQEEDRAILDSSIKNHKKKLNQLRTKFNEINSYNSDYEASLVNYASKKGFIEAQLENLNERQVLASELANKVRQKQELQADITNLDDQLNRLEAAQKRRASSVKNKISEKVIEILSYDGGIEPSFDKAQKFEFDFASDSMRLDDRANFSASSNVVLKNAFHLATLLIAVDDNKFRIPCFSMFDNIEDKGMRQERSHSFQQTIASQTRKLEGSFQVIMTTSMVDPTLNNDEFGVGPYYKKGTHTLNM